MQPVPRPPIESIVLTTMLGALVGALVWWPLLMTRALDSVPAQYQNALVIAILHLVGGLFTVSAAMAALWLRYRPVGNIRAGLGRIGSLFALGAVAAIAAASAFARSAGFSTSAVVVVAELAIAVACCALGAALGAIWWRRDLLTSHRH